MRSIRRTLLMYVLILLAVTFAVAAVLVDRMTGRAIAEKRQSAEALIDLRLNEKIDAALLERANLIGLDTQSQFNRTLFRNNFISSQLITILSPGSPSGTAPLFAQLQLTYLSPVSLSVHTRASTEILLTDDELYREKDSPEYEYIQIRSAESRMWQSRPLTNGEVGLDMRDVERRFKSAVNFETIESFEGPAVRRVIVKFPITRFTRSGGFGPRPPRGGDEGMQAIHRATVGVAHAAVRRGPPGGGGGGRPPAPPPGAGWPFINQNFQLPFMYVQCAWTLTESHPRLTGLFQERDRQLAELDEETGRTTKTLRRSLLTTVIGSLGIAVLVGWFLVGLGLTPLKRLSLAVSRITHRDFKVPIEPGTLTVEVSPVVDRLSLALNELQAAFEREKRAAADISHELRTPLAALRTTLDVVRRKPRTPEQYAETIDECRTIAGSMSRLVERMLRLAWIDAEHGDRPDEEVHVAALVGDCAAIGKPLAEEKGLRFQVNLSDECDSVRTDPDKFREVVMNLVHNAIAYNIPGGSIQIRTKCLDQRIVLEVEDTGIGMTPEVQSKIFERFYRADPSRHGTDVHAGLGLAIVKEYVDRMGGTIRVHSEVGKGTLFQVSLPRNGSAAT